MDLADLDYCLDLFKGTSQCHSMQRRPRHGNQTFAEIQIPSKLDNFLWKLNFDDFLKSLWKVGKGSFLIQNKSLQIFHCENISERGAQFQSNCFCCKLTKIYKKKLHNKIPKQAVRRISGNSSILARTCFSYLSIFSRFSKDSEWVWPPTKEAEPWRGEGVWMVRTGCQGEGDGKC